MQFQTVQILLVVRVSLNRKWLSNIKQYSVLALCTLVHSGTGEWKQKNKMNWMKQQAFATAKHAVLLERTEGKKINSLHAEIYTDSKI